MKKLLSLFLAGIIAMAALSAGGAAAETPANTLSVLSSNVSGIPVIGDYQGTQRALRGNARMAKIGEFISGSSGCDIVGTQEDFNLHDALAGAMTAYPYRTFSSGNLPLGDGLSAFSKYPVYNVKHTRWENSYGLISGSTDRLARKGILSSVIEIGDGLSIDFYVLHADAGGDPKSAKARSDNFRQLAEMINARGQDRAIIVVGDFNAALSWRTENGLYDNLFLPTGLKDCWVEVCNNGDYTYDGGAGWNPTLYETVDRVLFKSGGGIELKAEAIEYLWVVNESGETLTDHLATKAMLSYEVTGPVPDPGPLVAEEPFDPGQRRLDEFTATIQTLWLVLTNLQELIYLIGEGIGAV